MASKSNKDTELASTVTSALASAPPRERAALNSWLEKLVSVAGSDLLLVPGGPASIRAQGTLQTIDTRPLTGLEIEAAVLPALPPHALEEYNRTHIADCSYRVAGMGRFRINLHQQR